MADQTNVINQNLAGVERAQEGTSAQAASPEEGIRMALMNNSLSPQAKIAQINTYIDGIAEADVTPEFVDAMISGPQKMRGGVSDGVKKLTMARNFTLSDLTLA